MRVFLIIIIIISLKFIFDLGFDNINNKTNKLQSVHALHIKIALCIVP